MQLDGRILAAPGRPARKRSTEIPRRRLRIRRIGYAADCCRLREWLVADARRKAGDYVRAMARVRRALGADPALDAGMRVRFLWLRAMIELHDRGQGGYAASSRGTAAELIARLVDPPAPGTPAEIRDNTQAILAQTALLKARALLGANGLSGAENGFKELRENFPKQVSAAASYLVEGRYLAAQNRSPDNARRALAVFDEAGYRAGSRTRNPPGPLRTGVSLALRGGATNRHPGRFGRAVRRTPAIRSNCSISDVDASATRNDARFEGSPFFKSPSSSARVFCRATFSGS